LLVFDPVCAWLASQPVVRIEGGRQDKLDAPPSAERTLTYSAPGNGVEQ
jgi:hypothetical protein